MGKGKSHSPYIIGDYHIPVIIYKEYRRSIRFSVTKKGLIIRCPYLTPSIGIYDKAKLWCVERLKDNPSPFTEFLILKVPDYYRLTLWDNHYDVHVTTHNGDRDKVSWDDGKINIALGKWYTPKDKSKAHREMIVKFAQKRFKPIMTERVNQLNERHFNVEVGRVTLKNNRTNWGSCSGKGNINLSVRLLKAPEAVRDYVIIHELAHLIELNHSDRFWNLVKQACPDHKKYERWLKNNGHTLSF